MSKSLGRWLILLAALAAGPAYAQNESGSRPMNKAGWQQAHDWYDSTTSQYQVRYPIIRSLPPLNSGMPWDILAAYIYLDSLARFDNTGRTLNALNRWQGEGAMNDTLKWMIKYLYKVADYDPIMLRQYGDETALKLHTKYVSPINRIISETKQAYRLCAPDKTEMRAMYAMLYCDYILRVRVVGVDSMAMKVRGIFDSVIFNVTAEVLDTLKGRTFTTCGQQYSYEAHDEHGADALASTEGNHPCITFTYNHHHYPDPYGTADGPFLYYARDPEFSMSVDSGFTMRAGQDVVVFLSHHDPLKDSTNDYYNLSVDPQGWNALPILDGHVRDMNHAWVTSPSQILMSYDDWKNRFIALRDKMLSGAY